MLERLRQRKPAEVDDRAHIRGTPAPQSENQPTRAPGGQESGWLDPDVERDFLERVPRSARLGGHLYTADGRRHDCAPTEGRIDARDACDRNSCPGPRSHCARRRGLPFGAHHFEPHGAAPLRSGFVENIHADGPNVFAHEQYVLNGAAASTSYTVVIHVAAALDTSCAAPFLNLATATLTTNVAGNGSAYHVFTPADVDGLANSTFNAYWTVELNGNVVYSTDCGPITLDS
jgi:hypothetical protein